MRFFLENKSIIRGCKEHKAAGLGCAVDYRASFENLYAPFDCKVERRYTETKGGNWLWITAPGGNSWQYAHLDHYPTKLNEYKEGQVMALTGNTGSVTSGPHLHFQVIRPDGSRVDPEIAYQKVYDKLNMENKLIFVGESNKPNSGWVAIVIDGKKRIVSRAVKDRLSDVLLQMLLRNHDPRVASLTQADWDKIPQGIDF